MFEDYTYEALLEDVITKAPSGIDTRQGSIFYDAISGICMQIAKMYTDLDQVFQYVFITTASGKYLSMKASEYGLERHSATAARYYLEYSGTRPGEEERFFHNDSGKYFTVYNGGGSNLYLIAEEAGSGCNDIPVGDLAVPVNTINGLTSSNFGELYIRGTDEESDDDLRERILEKIAGYAENGNKQHYKTWCESIDGVGLARIIPLWNGENTVKGVLIDTEGQPLGEAKVEEVQNYIDPADKGMTVEVGGKTYVVGDGLGNGQANIGAHFTAVAASPLSVAVTFTAEIASGATKESVEDEATEAIETYFSELVLGSDNWQDVVVRVSSIGAILSRLNGLVDYSDLKLNGSTNNITPGEDEVPVLEEVTAE